MMNVDLPGRGKRSPQRRFMEVVKGGIERVGVAEEDARDRVRLRQMIYSGELEREELREEEEEEED